MTRTFLIFHRKHNADCWGKYWEYTYLRRVRWGGTVFGLQRVLDRTDPEAIAKTPKWANRKFPNVGEWT